MDERVVLPTLEFVQNTKFDCERDVCKDIAYDVIREHSKSCLRPLYIYHQRLPSMWEFQTIVRHGNGEAVFIDYNGDGFLTDFEIILVWLENVHQYEGLAPIGLSSNGRTTDFESENLGSIPRSPAKIRV